MNYLDSLADQIRQELDPDLRPEARGDELFRLYALLVLVAGQHCTMENVHDAWSTWMAAEDPEHEALIPFGQLSREAQLKDMPYLSAIHLVASASHR
jgi:hypothetical protein